MDIEIALGLTPPLGIRFEDPPTLVGEFLEAEYGHLRRPADDSADPDFVFRFVDAVEQPAAWESLGVDVHITPESLLLLDTDGRARLYFDEGGFTSAEIERSVSLDFVRLRIIDPVIGLLALRRDAVTVHASATRGPRGGVLLLGPQGCGKTGVLVGLIKAGHGYVADDRLLVTADGRVLPLQGLLGLRRNVLATDDELRRAAAGSGWTGGRVAHATLQGGRRAMHAVPTRPTRRVAGVLRKLEDALAEHCYYVDPHTAFPTAEFGAGDTPVTACLLSRGAPEIAEPAAEGDIERWLLEETVHESETLVDLLGAAARISAPWRSALSDTLERRRAIVASAAGTMSGVRVRTQPAETETRAVELVGRALDLATATPPGQP